MSIDRYTGVLYEAFDHRSLSAVKRRRLDGSVLILSGLWGAAAPFDPIPDYKLKMGVAWRAHTSGFRYRSSLDTERDGIVVVSFFL